jgi:Chromo (CHRromatin Organisation MOdifier) domain
VIKPMVSLPVLSPGGQWKIELIAVLDRRIVKKKNAVSTEILVKWSNLDSEEATWEDYSQICEQFSGFKLEDKLSLEERVLSQARGGRPVAVGGTTFKFKNKGTQRMGLDAQGAEANVMGLEDKISGSQLCPIPAERDRPMRVSLMIELPY